MAGVWRMSWMTSWGRRGREKCRPQLPQHDPKPLLIRARLFLLLRNMNKLAQLLLPHGLPIEVPMFIHVECFICIEGGQDARDSRGWRE